jgi:hypothetical protein
MGCNRGLTRTEHEQSRGSRSARNPHLSAERKAAIRRSMQRLMTGPLLEILSDPEHRAHAAAASLLVKAVENPRDPMPENEQRLLVGAFVEVVRDHPDAIGIFQAASKYGPGATPLSHPYELFAAASLVTAPHQSLSGRKFAIDPVDRLDFGIKMAKGYSQPKRFGTIEADIMIHKPKNVIDETITTLDAKFSRTGVYQTTHGLARQLDGIRIGLRGLVTRHCWVDIEYQTADGKNVAERIEGFPAMIFQHEFDHLEGVLYKPEGGSFPCRCRPRQSSWLPGRCSCEFPP